METCSTWEISTLDLPDRQTEANLREFIMDIPDLAQPATQLFYEVNKMFSKDSHIFQFNPSRGQQAREVVAGLLVFLKASGMGSSQRKNFTSFSMTVQLKGPETPGGMTKTYVW